MPLLGIFSRRTQRQRLSSVRERFDPDKFDFDHQIRLDRYAVNLAMLNNVAYRKEVNGGMRESILKETFDLDCTDETPLIGTYNPIRNIVDAYQNVFRGTYGQEIRVDEKVDDRDVNPALADLANSPVRRLWGWSNFDTYKSICQEWAANLGTVGLCIQSRDNTDAAQRRVSIRIDHPANIIGFNEDDRGNVTEIELKYNVMQWEPGDDAPEQVEIREVFTKTRRVKEVGGENDLEPDQQRNELGVCPYVILRHRDDGHEFGRWAYEGSEEIIHWLNWIITNQGQSVHDHAWPEWFAAAAGKGPQEWPLGSRKVAYVQMDSGKNGSHVPPPIFEPLVADVDHGGAVNFFVEMMTRLQERQPEIAIGNVKALSGQSGETIAKLLIPAEAAVMRARAQYEDALIRAMQIGLSEGVRLGIWDLGTGTGSVEVADSAFRTGKEDFAFAERPALPQSVFDEIQQANAEQARPMAKANLAKAYSALGVDDQTVLEAAGFTEEQIKDIVARRKTAVPTEPL